MRAIELGNEKAASSTSAIPQSIINNIDNDKIKHNNPHNINNINNNQTKHNNLYSTMQASEYYYLRKKSSTSSSKGPISRYSNQPEVKDHALSAHQSSGSDNHTNEPNFGLFDQDGVVMMMGRVLIVVGECYPIDSGDLGD
ncbi:hypothetical protein PPACK8108_LOCUS18093 [Phakopsora pachyrhizi]|uniref:Uncharacterized protein n=1 Tax=Phakopsora pachyrhizi TaxID=170000 RepID=A0AAV0BDE7_PHAPC|nr:hypothetical protein PPACK8108_LOCUS18093 [Phakopsora pachyrhizi]